MVGADGRVRLIDEMIDRIAISDAGTRRAGADE